MTLIDNWLVSSLKDISSVVFRKEHGVARGCVLVLLPPWTGYTVLPASRPATLMNGIELVETCSMPVSHVSSVLTFHFYWHWYSCDRSWNCIQTRDAACGMSCHRYIFQTICWTRIQHSRNPILTPLLLYRTLEYTLLILCLFKLPFWENPTFISSRWFADPFGVSPCFPQPISGDQALSGFNRTHPAKTQALIGRRWHAKFVMPHCSEERDPPGPLSAKKCINRRILTCGFMLSSFSAQRSVGCHAWPLILKYSVSGLVSCVILYNINHLLY